MPSDERPVEPASFDAADAGGFAASLGRRKQAAEEFERDILTEVPLLYGSPGSLERGGDPGIALARLHRENLVRRNGGGVSQASGKRSDVALPFEQATTALAILLFLFFMFAH